MTFFDDAEQKQKELQAIFARTPIVTLSGVVDPAGTGGSKSPPETQWTFNVGLSAWRVAGGPLREASLVVSKLVSDEELRTLQGAICPDSVISFEAKLCESSPFGDARAQLVRMLDGPAVQSDPELERILAHAIAPVEFDDPVLGRLILNRRLGWFEGQLMWLGEPIDLALAGDGEMEKQSAIRTAKVLLESMLEWSRQIKNVAVVELLDLKNTSWRDEGEEAISHTEFLKRMQLTSLAVYADGSFEFWHDDGDLFWGHAILVSGSLATGVTNASITG